MATDYHDFTKYETPKNFRKSLNVGDIWINAAICHKCAEYVRSRNVHDFVTCRCGNISVDGGSYYAKRSFEDRTGSSWTDIVVPYKESTNADV
jgi:hypothetical protein